MKFWEAIPSLAKLAESIPEALKWFGVQFGKIKRQWVERRKRRLRDKRLSLEKQLEEAIKRDDTKEIDRIMSDLSKLGA